MKLVRHRQISLNNSERLWCSLLQMHFPQIFSFVGNGAGDDAKPLNCQYTLNPKARPWAPNVVLAPIDRIESDLHVGRRTKSLVLRHHETLERALGYLSGVEDVTNTCDDAELYKCSDGIFTLTLRATDRKVPSRGWLELGWRSLRVVQPNDFGVGALERRPRHDEGYHEGGGCGRRSFAFG